MVAVVTNAKDYKTPSERTIKVKEVLDFFSDLGVKPVELDLRKYFTSQVNLENEIKKYQAIWMAGGNVFLLRRALKQTGLDRILGDQVRKNEIVYGGDSAGAMIAGPTLKGTWNESEDEDNPNFIAEGYNKKVIWEGLNFINYVPVPHYQSVDYGDFMDEYVKYLEQQGWPYKTMREEQAIVINDDQEEFLE